MLDSCRITRNVFLGSEVLDTLNYRGQGYDGAGSVAGKDKALQVKIAAVVSFKKQCIRKTMGKIEEITNLFNFSVP